MQKIQVKIKVRDDIPYYEKCDAFKDLEADLQKLYSDHNAHVAREHQVWISNSFNDRLYVTFPEELEEEAHQLATSIQQWWPFELERLGSYEASLPQEEYKKPTSQYAPQYDTWRLRYPPLPTWIRTEAEAERYVRGALYNQNK